MTVKLKIQSYYRTTIITILACAGYKVWTEKENVCFEKEVTDG